MKIIVISDSHGSSININKVLNLHPDAEYVIHLGDGIDDLNSIMPKHPNIHFLTVNGNKEDGFFSQKSALPFSVLTVMDKKIIFCHGHRHNVNYSHHNLIYTAREQGADIALYGHTHIKHNEYIPLNGADDSPTDGIYLFNPGSISLPRDGSFPSFGLIEIRDNGILLSHGTIKR